MLNPKMDNISRIYRNDSYTHTNQLKNIDQWLDSMQCQAYILTSGNDLDGLENAINVSPEQR